MSAVFDPELSALKLPPHSVEAEQSVLGGLMLENTAWERVADLINEQDFYRADHKSIWRQIGVSTPPGSIVFTRMRRGAPSLAATRDSSASAAFDAP